MKPSWKIDAMINALGGDRAVMELLTEHKFPTPPSLETISAWRRRNSAPGAWALALLYVCVREGVLDDLDKIRVAA